MANVPVMEPSSPKTDFDYIHAASPSAVRFEQQAPSTDTTSSIKSDPNARGSGRHDTEDRLAISVFAMPVPYLTAHWEVKLGDLLLTLPITIAVIVVNFMKAVSDKDVEGTGKLPSYALILVFLFAVRNNSVLLAATGISYERALFYHKIVGFATIVLTGLHGLAYLLAKDDGQAFENSYVLTGCLAFFPMIALYVLSLNFIRRQFFELFLRLHWILFLVILVFTVIHAASIVLVGAIPWVIDMLFRVIYRPRVYAKGGMATAKTDKADADGVQAVETPTTYRLGVIARDQVTARKLPGDVTCIQFPRVRADTGEAFKFKPGQYAFLCIPEIGMLEWHPFTISSAPHEDMVTFHIRSLGDWTSKLANLVSQAPEGLSVPATFELFVDGPYGTLSIDLDGHLPTTNYSHVVMFCGGIGITPMRAIINQLHHDIHNEKKRLSMRGVLFVWAVRDFDLVSAFMKQDPASQSRSYLPHRLLTSAGGTPTATAGLTFLTDIIVTDKPEMAPIGDFEAGQQLAHLTQLGERPNIAQILRETGESAQMEVGSLGRVAVLGCGPESMVRDAISSGISLSHEMNVRFDVHHEYFSF